MIGFGFMDNLVMIQAGDLIDSTFGVTFGLSTLTAAAYGQVVSDVSGTLFGNTMDALADRVGLPQAGLTKAHHRLPRVKAVGMAVSTGRRSAPVGGEREAGGWRAGGAWASDGRYMVGQHRTL